jgi:hypothetical protein
MDQRLKPSARDDPRQEYGDEGEQPFRDADGLPTLLHAPDAGNDIGKTDGHRQLLLHLPPQQASSHGNA